MKAFKVNHGTWGGYISHVDIKKGNNDDWYGSFSLALEDNYQKNRGKPDQEWVDRVHFAEVKVDQHFLNNFDAPIGIGDQIVLTGKIIQEKWKDKQSGANRSGLKIKADKKIAYMTKTESDLLKSNANE